MKRKLFSLELTSIVRFGACFILHLFFVPMSNGNNPSLKSYSADNDPLFSVAQPVWPAGQQLEKNITIGFRGNFDVKEGQKVILKITGSSLYRIYLNGQFIGHGPARAAHGYYRVDELDLRDELMVGANILAIEVAGYNVNSYYLLDQPSFLQAEIISDGNVLLASGNDKNDFVATTIKERIQKVPRYSFQRPFIECYKLAPGAYDWRTNSEGPSVVLDCEKTDSKNVLPRGVAYSDFNVLSPIEVFGVGQVQTGQKVKRYWKDRAVTDIGEKLGGFKEEELEINPVMKLQEMRSKNQEILKQSYSAANSLSFASETYKIFDFDYNATGFIGAKIKCEKPGRLYFLFDEILSDEDVDFKRLSCINALTYDLLPGNYSIESFEPYTFKYLKIIMIDGKCDIENVSLREYVNPDISRAEFVSSNEQLNLIYKAGVETFRQNAVDIFMDCPSRERAGWLCDSYFTARVAADLSGNTLVEKNFIENYLLAESFEHLPEGMLPMCYPADHDDGVFIPNWAMWFVIQLEEYYERSGDRALVDALKPRVMGLLEYFDAYINDDGLLEKLDSWIFVEWSAANSFVQDVNYPTNMLLSATLESASNLYSDPALKSRAENIRETIRKQSFNGEFFVDNAIRNKKGELTATSNVTEVCQYYAFYFNIATPDTYPELWDRLVTNFGPSRKENNKYPDVHFANSFPGNYLRLELLSRNKKASQLLGESIDFFSYMAERTGTLWENISTSASCNHGFASHTVHFLYRDVLGIYDVDLIDNVITLQFSDMELSSCKGQIPIGDEIIALKWVKKGDSIHFKVDAPKRFKIVVNNQSKLKLIEQ